jgi:cell division protein ZapE
LNRQLFVPFIKRIIERLEVFHLVSDTDYRQGRQRASKAYFTPLNARSRHDMDRAWELYSVSNGQPLTLTVNGREIELPLHCEGVGRASFAALCEVAFGPADYLEIANSIAVLLLDDIPVLTREQAGPAKRFVTLIDALYEAKVKLIASAAAAPESLFERGDGAFEFERTASRLREMMSAKWLEEAEGHVSRF